MIKNRLALFATAALLASAIPVSVAAQQATARPPAAQQPVEGIAAVVNDAVISVSDVRGRLQLAMATSGLPDNNDTRQRLLPQVVRLLVDESLQVQEAQRLNLVVTDEEIDKSLQGIAQQNRMTLEQFSQALQRSGIPPNVMREQARANLAWSKLVQRRIRPTIQIGDEEIDRVVQRIQANAGQPEFLTSEIFIPVDGPANETSARQLADRLVEQIGQGANFAAVAQQFSQAAGAAVGGDIGWVQAGQLEPAVDRALQQLQKGQLSRPVRGSAGYHILLVRDQRTILAGDPGEIKISLQQLVLPAASDADATAAYKQAAAIAEKIQNCAALEASAKLFPGAQTGQLPPTKLADIPGQIGQIVRSLAVNRVSEPLVTDRGVMLLMVCERQVPEGSTPPRDQILNNLGAERMDMLQRRYLRDLRRTAVIDIRF